MFSWLWWLFDGGDDATPRTVFPPLFRIRRTNVKRANLHREHVHRLNIERKHVKRLTVYQ